MIWGDMPLKVAGVFLFAAEVLGIVEELPGSYKGTETNG
jgi:hypothetical protein